MKLPAKDTPVELFETRTKKDSEGIDRQIPESIGFYTTEQIQRTIDSLTASLQEWQAKLDAVNNALAQEEI